MGNLCCGAITEANQAEEKNNKKSSGNEVHQHNYKGTTSSISTAVVVVSLQCDKKWVGRIIGSNGGTIKKMQQDSGTTIVVNSSIDPSKVTITGQTAGAVERARHLIENIIEEAENPDYEGRKGHALREEARRCHDKADACFAQGDRTTGMEWNRKCEAATEKAAAAIFEHRNRGKGLLHMDFHGLHKKEALLLLDKRLKTLGADGTPVGKGNRQLELVTGAGHHSDGEPILKPAIQMELNELGLQFKQKNVGDIIVTV